LKWIQALEILRLESCFEYRPARQIVRIFRRRSSQADIHVSRLHTDCLMQLLNLRTKQPVLCLKVMDAIN
jgi:hypothetical protein